MARAMRVTILFLGAAAALGGACKGEEKKEEAGLKFPPGWTPPTIEEPQEAGTKGVPKEAEGWLVADPGADKLVLVSQAIVKLNSTKDHRAEGMMWLTETEDGLRIKVDLKGLAFMTKYAVRVHLLGDCSAPDGTSAGPPMSFSGSSLDPRNGPGTGLLGELQAAVQGEAKGETITGAASLQGHYSIIGRSIVVHGPPGSSQKSDDPLGPRLACGVIGVLANIQTPEQGLNALEGAQP